jgi:(1->4)-alpha-D-glucan 1-alpha-D-glucosylmutase
VLKSAREAKQRTSWVSPNQRYDDALARFAETIVDPRRSREFLRDLGEFQARVAHVGRFNSLAQTLVKITAPGVPDFYQGTELWDFSLVDPDNRRPVDFELRRRRLDELARAIDTTTDLAALARRLVTTIDEGTSKLYLTRQALGFRRQHRELFLAGAYLALTTGGPWAEHLCAFARARGGDLAVVIVPRLLARRGFSSREAPGATRRASDQGTDDLPLGAAYWDDTRVTVPVAPGTRLRDVFTGRVVTVVPGDDDAQGGAVLASDALADFPVALLEAT